MEFNCTHSSETLNKLNEERKTNEGCDFTMKAEGENFPVHKCVVGSFSEYFRAMFTVKMKESYLNEGIVKDVSGPTMASILEFMYTSNTILTHNNVYYVLEASEYLPIPKCCAKFFMKSMNGENCLKIRSYSNQYNMDDLVQAAETFISKNLRAVLKSFDFLQLNLDDVKALLKLENYEDLIDEDKFKSVADWTKYDNDARRKHFYDLFQLIPLDYLSKTFLTDVVYVEVIC
ncbi:unnamed protein product [Clavelina lepadiformis]|uniref:BTB domain-containing protein n=1 Tax=Clavelina lepadiformis TaxID=159417 RepID=A0ABP0G919_CLALP